MNEREIIDHINSAIRCLEDARKAIYEKDKRKAVNQMFTRAKEYIVEARSNYNEKPKEDRR